MPSKDTAPLPGGLLVMTRDAQRTLAQLERMKRTLQEVIGYREEARDTNISEVTRLIHDLELVSLRERQVQVRMALAGLKPLYGLEED